MECVVSQLKRVAAQALIGLISVTQILILVPARAAAAGANHVVISQIKTSSTGNAADEFIELYNPTNVAVYLGDWSVQYRGGAAGSFDKQNLSSATLPAHSYYLISNMSSSYSFNDDQSYGNAGMSLSATGGTVFLVNNETTLTTGSEASIIDKVAYGSGSLFAEGSPAVAPAAGTSIVRLPNNSNGNGTDTDNNSADFMVLSPATPRSLVSDPQPFGTPNVVLSTTATKVTATWNKVTSADAYSVNMTMAASCAEAVFADPATTITATNDASYSHDFAALPQNWYAVQVKAMRDAEVTTDCETVMTPQLTIVDANETAEIVYRKNSVAGTVFGPGTVDVEVTIDGVLSNSQKPLQATYRRPNSVAVTQYLNFDSDDDVWRGSFTIMPGTASQDGPVLVTITTAESENVPITVGSSFTVDTRTTTPVVAAQPVCGPSEDMLHITTDSDVAYAYVYSSSTVDANQLGQNLVVSVPMVNGHATAMIGNNLYGALSVLAIDMAGNMSSLASVTNDIQAPAMPTLNVTTSDSTITTRWMPPTGATSFLLRWKKTTDTTWQQIPVGDTSHSIKAENNVPYDIALASVDSYCNASAFTMTQATPKMLAAVSAVSMGDYESELFARSLTVGQAKDGTGTKSPYSVEEDKDQNGILDRDEDKNGNGIKDGDETASPAPTAQTKDNSRVIAIIAIILIIAGAALAAYSWYKGDDSSAKDDKDKKDGGTPPPSTESAAAPTEEKAAEPKQSSGENSKSKRGGKGGKRKTRW